MLKKFIFVTTILFLTGSSAYGQLPDFADLVEEVAPAVVKINTVTKGPARQSQPNLQGQLPEIFRELLEQRNRQQQPPRQARSMGSGFVISEDGYLLTNHHVIDGADEIQVLFSDRREYSAKIIGSDRSETVNAIAATSFRVLQAPLGPIEPSIDWECRDHVNRTTRNGDVVSRIALLLFSQGAILEPRRRQSRRARRSSIAFGWCESSSPRGSSIVPGLRGGRSSYSQSASEGTRRIGAITLAPALKGHAVTR